MATRAPITQTTWVAVFDGGHAVTFANEGFDDAPNLRCVSSVDAPNPPSRDQDSDRPGRWSTPSGGRAAAEPRGAHDAAETTFAEDYAREIEAAANTGQFDRLVVIAPGPLLTVFRDAAPRASSLIAGVRAGDFAHAPVKEIERAFHEALSGQR